ncbi:MAG: (Fe-S)-binding protein, partial [Candidatus Lokiarchaeota archaeon]|nr:(Fe-S)-binding protein [Candidatus Lokiarchaeota archaeon]
HEFLERYLGKGEALAWPCTGCRACEAVCPAERKPYQLVRDAMRDFLKGHENALSDYHQEYLEHGRIGASRVFLDDLVLPAKIAGRLAFLQSFDRIIVFPGCLVSARYPWLVHRLYQLLVMLGVDTKNIVVDDESCCGSFLLSTSDEEYVDAGEQLFKVLTKKPCKSLVITTCGSCTSTLQDIQHRLLMNTRPKKVAGNPAMATIMHYTELLAMPGCIDVLKPVIERLVTGHARGGARGGNGKGVGDVTGNKDGNKDGNGRARNGVYVQFPCQVAADPVHKQQVITGLKELLTVAGYTTARVNHDLGCCGAGLLDTHPDLAIEYGIHRISNITGDSDIEVSTIAVACGNCHRILVDFKPAIEVECDCITMDVGIRFLLDMLMELMLP